VESGDKSDLDLRVLTAALFLDTLLVARVECRPAQHAVGCDAHFGTVSTSS
jgi:hypothetical protein